MLPAKYDIKVYRGDTWRRVVRFRTINADGTSGAYADLTGCVPLAQVRTAAKAPDILATLVTAVLDQTAEPGAVQIELRAVDTAELPDSARWDLQLTHPNGDVHTYLAGRVIATGQITVPETGGTA